jgi:hypothetical protein
MSSGMLRHVALVTTDVSEELSASKRRFLQEQHGVTSQKTSFFIFTAVKTSNLTKCSSMGRLLIETYGDTKRCGPRGPSYCGSLGISSQRASVASYSYCCS